jgi:hypothetical protein
MPSLSAMIRKLTAPVRSGIRWLFPTRAAIVVFLALGLLLPLYILIFSTVMPVVTYRHAPAPADTSRRDPANPPVSTETSPEIKSRIHMVQEDELDKAFLQNRYTLARKDSIYLCLNLSDSVLTMEIKGVVVRSCRLADLWSSRRLDCLDHEQRLRWCSTPFTLKSSLATIPKTRYVIKQAPKDTIEAALQDSKPMPPDTSTVFFTLYFNRNLVIDVEQTEPPFDTDRNMIRSYYRTKNNLMRQQALNALLQFTAPNPTITFHLRMSKADALAIYRGIPVKSQLALTF